MKKYFIVLSIFFSLFATAQDTAVLKNSNSEKKPVKIFSSEKAINAFTTEVVAKGKMEFNVVHNFGDIAGKEGGTRTFFGLDAVADARIGFHIGLTDRLNLNLARDAGGGTEGILRVTQLYEIALKYQLLRQLENDPTHPFAATIFFNNVISSMEKPTINQNESWRPNRFNDFGERMSQVFQVIIAKKIGKVSLQVNPTMVHMKPVFTYEQKTIYALGGAIRVPITRNLNLIVDYFHPFRSKESKESFKDTSITKFALPINFYDPLGIGFEIITAGHIFHLNFTNAREILENRYIPYTSKSWGKGQYRWGFTISRKFVLWREKE